MRMVVYTSPVDLRSAPFRNIHRIHKINAKKSMDTKRKSRSCRICGSVVPPTHCVALFSMKSLTAGLADRLSKVADVPVAPDDGLTKFICGICSMKFCQQSRL